MKELKIRIPTSKKEFKQLWKERFSKRYRSNVKVLERMTEFFIETTLNGRWIEISEGKVEKWSEMDKYQFIKEMRDKCNSYIHDLME